VRPSLRFLGLAVFGWAGIRAATVGALPGAEIFRIEASQAKPPPITPTQFPEIEPVAPAAAALPAEAMVPAAFGYPQAQAFAPAPRTVVLPVYYAPAPVSQVTAAAPALSSVLPEPRRQFYAGMPAFPEYPMSQMTSASYPPLGSGPVTAPQSVPVALKRSGIDRLQLTAWALLRSQSATLGGTQSLASGGSLGASQAGSRLTYFFTRQIAATLRSTTTVGRRGGEVAAGVRVQPLASIPVWIDAERRQRIGRLGGGRTAFALFMEGGVYDRPMPLHFLLDSYLQAGVVGFRSRDKFIDGSLTLTRPVYKQFSAGFGVWGGAQPGLYRVDAGPRVTMRVKGKVRVHFDWRQRLAGNALPGSGPAVTLAGDF
jgi:hypothetical protein